MLSAAVERHVALMRACGFVFDTQATQLAGFAAFAGARGEPHVRTATVLDWSHRAGSHAQRRIVYLTVRRFALTAVTEDARHEVPPPDLLPQTARQRPAPYIYAPEEVAALVSVADRAASRRCRVPGQYRALFGLIAATGMRISEAIGLDIADLTPDGLLIREAKRRGRRLLPLHPSVEVEFRMHLTRRARVRNASDAIFLGDRGGRLCYGTARGAFSACWLRPGSRGSPKAAGTRGSTICAIPSLSGRWKPATPGAATSPATWWLSAPGSVMSTSSTPTGISRVHRRCSARSRIAPRPSRRGAVLMTPLARYLSIWLREHLPVDRGVSPNTVDAYSQSLAALLRFAADRLRRPPSELAFEEIDAPLILAFLEEIERRGASVRTRNARLAAIKALFRFLEYRLPAALEQIRQVQAIPRKKADEALVAWLTRAEIGALLAAPDPRTRDGIRDRAMLSLAYACGLRVSELTGLRLADYDRRDPASLHVTGKGRRERVLPLWKETRTALDAWLRHRDPDGDVTLFHNRSSRAMTRSGFEYILARHVGTAAKDQPGIAEKTGDAACAAPFLRHAHAAGDGRRPQGIALARPRLDPEHRDLPPRRPHGEAGDDRRHDHAETETRPLPPAGQAARHARRQRTPMIMRSDNPEKWRRRNTRRPQLRITISSAYYGV